MTQQNIENQLTDYAPPLKDGATSFGSFYPTNYVLAVFRSDTSVDAAKQALLGAGFPDDDVIVASGQDVAEHDASLHASQGVLTKLGEKWSRLYTDDAANADAIMGLARQGAALVLAYAPNQADTMRAANALRTLNPLILRKYEALTSKDLDPEAL